MKMYESFNRSGLSIFLNSMPGRILRLIAGIGSLAIGFVFREHILGVLSMVWGVLPLTAGLFDVCYISAVLGGPLSGKKIRSMQTQTSMYQGG
jgi:hypothetical protein